MQTVNALTNNVTDKSTVKKKATVKLDYVSMFINIEGVDTFSYITKKRGIIRPCDHRELTASEAKYRLMLPFEWELEPPFKRLVCMYCDDNDIDYDANVRPSVFLRENDLKFDFNLYQDDVRRSNLKTWLLENGFTVKEGDAVTDVM